MIASQTTIESLEYQCQQHIQPVRCNASAETADGVCADGLADELAVAEAVEHGGVGAEKTAPAHTDSREHGDSIVVDDAFSDETRHQTDGSAYSAKSGHGEGNQGAVLEAEEPFEDDVDLVGCPADDGHAFVSHTKVFAVVARRAEGQHHHDGGDAKHAGDDGEADANAVLATVEQRVEETHEHAAFGLERDLLLITANSFVNRSIQLGIGLQGGALHQSCGDDAADDGTCHTDQCAFAKPETCHKSNHDQAHTEGRAEVGQRNELVFLEIAVEVLVVRQSDDGGIVAEERHHGSQGRHARQVVERLHQWAQEVFQQTYHTEFGEQLADGAHEYADGHDVEHGFKQQVICRLHKGVQHLGQGHLVSQETEEGEEDDEEDESFNASFGSEP